jgi:hypothetical protein
MAIKHLLICAAILAPTFAQQATNYTQQSLANRIGSMSEADQRAFLDYALGRGLQPPDLYSPASVLMLTKPSWALPVVERKIEEVLKSPVPHDCFADKTVDPERFISIASAGLVQGGTPEGLVEASKLLALDESRFDLLVATDLAGRIVRDTNPVQLAYFGYDMNSPAVTQRIAAWLEEQLGIVRGTSRETMERWWAEAWVERYGDAPLDARWPDDPVKAHLSPKLAQLLKEGVAAAVADRVASRKK